MTNAVLKKGACATTKERGKRSTTCAPTNVPAQSLIQCCEIRIEECCDGCKIYCECEDKAACTKLQNLCRQFECCSCRVECAQSGAMCCQCCFDGCEYSCQMLTNGICICCTTNDEACLKMVQAMCCCLGDCRECGCMLTVCIDDQAVCCCAC